MAAPVDVGPAGACARVAALHWAVCGFLRLLPLRPCSLGSPVACEPLWVTPVTALCSALWTTCGRPAPADGVWMLWALHVMLSLAWT